ncbi:MAG: hypothetical protein ACRC6I_18190 [Paracoccaceae bacterium]
MGYDSLGTHSRLPGSSVVSGSEILASRYNLDQDDISQSFNQVILRNGTTPFTEKQPGIAGTSPNDLVIKQQLDDVESQINGSFTTGLWNSATNYVSGQRCEDGVAVYYAIIPSINKPPATSPAEWGLMFRKFTGGQLSSKLSLAASTLAYAPINIPEGLTPNNPVNGDLWPAFGGLFYRSGGFTVRIMTNNDTTSWVSGSVCGFSVGASQLGWQSFTGAASVVPFDNTAPLVIEGIEFASVVHAVKSATNRVVASATISVASSASQQVTVAIFEGTELRQSQSYFVDAGAHTLSIKTIPFFPGSGSETYSVRVGQQSAANIIYSNGGNGVPLFGGTMFSFIDVTEYV